MREYITKLICDYVADYHNNNEAIATAWGRPLVGFADAAHPYVRGLKQTIGPEQQLPEEVLPQAKTIIAYYVPFTKELAVSNNAEPELASAEWARAYEETNAMLDRLNRQLIKALTQKGYQAAISPASLTYDRVKLCSNWSQRHYAYAAGLGTFGLNNMLITVKGCCGRYSTVVTDLQVAADAPLGEELCLYKKNGSCGICLQNCPAGALSPQVFDRRKCSGQTKKNAAAYTEFGCSYAADGIPNSGSEVCGKCVTASPCAFWQRTD